VVRICRIEEKCVQGVCGKPEGKRLLGRHNSRRKDEIRMDLRELGWWME
jgi:hypothetical protein